MNYFKEYTPKVVFGGSQTGLLKMMLRILSEPELTQLELSELKKKS